MNRPNRERIEGRVRELRARVAELDAAIEGQDRELAGLMAAEAVDDAAAELIQEERDRLRREHERRELEARAAESRLPAADKEDAAAAMAEVRGDLETAFGALAAGLARFDAELGRLEAATEEIPAADLAPLWGRLQEALTAARENGLPAPDGLPVLPATEARARLKAVLERLQPLAEAEGIYDRVVTGDRGERQRAVHEVLRQERIRKHREEEEARRMESYSFR